MFCFHLVEKVCSNCSSVILQPVGKLDDHALTISSHCLWWRSKAVWIYCDVLTRHYCIYWDKKIY